MAAAPRIVFLDAATLSDLPAFSRFSDLGEFISYPRSSQDQLVERAAGAQVVIVNKCHLSADLLAQLPELKLVCIAATGMNNVDREATEARGIPVRNVAGYSTDSVAQLTLTALFAVAMDLVYLNQAVYAGEYSKAKDFALWRQPFYELRGARFGILGMGTIGRRVAGLATAYGAEVVYYSVRGNDHDVPYPRLASLDEFLASCDVVSIHCALTEETDGLLGYAELRKMKSSAYLVNMARGGIVEEDALVRALDAGLLAGAAVDVFTQEPLPADHPYLGIQYPHRLLLTPHVGWASVEARTTLIEGIVANIDAGW